jgi:hypothetical protein
MPLSEKFKALAESASYDDLLEIKKDEQYLDRQKRDYLDQQIEVARQRADEAHRERTEQHMDTMERQGWGQLILSVTWLGIQLIPVGGALAVGLAIGAALG